MAVENDSPAALLSDIARRLRPLCHSMPDDEFRELVRDIARVKLKYPLPADKLDE